LERPDSRGSFVPLLDGLFGANSGIIVEVEMRGPEAYRLHIDQQQVHRKNPMSSKRQNWLI
jgi:hypothetical protein